ncbi:hypothetical protein WJX81_003616 [Elliptochloris bilobata]|uniref:SAP domain-containing protein n=1 Tax=Elliptochloris bilobata TaxID=381761 RepID=A0AAW1SI49_9CHLO
MRMHALPAVGEVGDVEEVAGVRVVLDEESAPAIEYLVKWKVNKHHALAREPPENLADNLLRDFEERWWKHCKEGDEEALRKLLASSAPVLAHVVDENRRSALHFAAAIGNLACTKLLIEAGSDLNLGEKDGYTPLHMAVGYSHMLVAAALLEAGADPELEDRQGRNVVMLVESIRDSMPINAALVSRRMALEQVSGLLSDCLFEEVTPAALLDDRPCENGTRDFLVKWSDGAEDSWVNQLYIAPDVVEDYDSGLEYGTASRVLRMVQRGDEREFLIQWEDGHEDTWELEDHADFDEELQEEEEHHDYIGPPRENCIFLIDCQPDMNRPCGIDDRDGEYNADTTFSEVAVVVAREIMKAHIISNSRDSFAVVLYGTRKSENEHNHENVYVFQNLDEPSAERIKALTGLLDSGLEELVGNADKSPEHLRNALWTAHQLLDVGSSKADKRVFIFTCDANPAGHSITADKYRGAILTRANDLHEKHVAVEVLPMVPPGTPFDMAFWSHVQGAAVADDEDGDAVPALETGDTFWYAKGLYDAVRKKAYRKRTSGRVRWALGPGMELAVALYTLLMPAQKGAGMWVYGATNEELTIESANICQDTGAVMQDVAKVQFPKSPEKCRFDPVVFPKDDLRALKYVQSPGLKLLGFKPASCLRPWHRARQSTFVYPNERALAGSTVLFIALWARMHARKVVAVCSYARSRSASPRLVALVPAQEATDLDGNQVEPPGMHMVYLPTKEDLRDPEADPRFRGDAWQTADEAQVEAAMAMIRKLRLPEYVPDAEPSGELPAWELGALASPMLQRHYQVLEAYALGEELPEQDDMGTRPDNVAIGCVGGAEIAAFREAVYGPEHDEPGQQGAVRKAAAKRKAPEPDPAAEAVLAAMNYKALAADGQLNTLKNDDLKAYLRAKHLKVGGKKDELIARIMEAEGVV